jgi:hypothetical protein
MNGKGFELIPLLKKAAEKPGEIEILYIQPSFLDTLFEREFGATTIEQSVERTSEKAVEAESKAGIGGILALFLDLKACFAAKAKVGEAEKTIIKQELSEVLKIKLCEASLESKGSIIDNPQSGAAIGGKYLRVDYPHGAFQIEDEKALDAQIGFEAAEVVRERWMKDQKLTPNVTQVALAVGKPFRMVGIVMVQSGLLGSTYVASPPPDGAHRSMLAERGFERGEVTFLRPYWVIERK